MKKLIPHVLTFLIYAYMAYSNAYSSGNEFAHVNQTSLPTSPITTVHTSDVDPPQCGAVIRDASTDTVIRTDNLSMTFYLPGTVDGLHDRRPYGIGPNTTFDRQKGSDNRMTSSPRKHKSKFHALRLCLNAHLPVAPYGVVIARPRLVLSLAQTISNIQTPPPKTRNWLIAGLLTRAAT